MAVCNITFGTHTHTQAYINNDVLGIFSFLVFEIHVCAEFILNTHTYVHTQPKQ